MGRRKVSIDDLLAENSLDLEIGGKVYNVKDFDLTEFLHLMKIVDANDPEAQDKFLRQQLAKVLGCPEKDLAEHGIRALALAMQEIQRWITSEAEAVTGAPPGHP